MTLSRRGFLTGLIAAPAIVKIESIMPVRSPKLVRIAYDIEYIPIEPSYRDTIRFINEQVFILEIDQDGTIRNLPPNEVFNGFTND